MKKTLVTFIIFLVLLFISSVSAQIEPPRLSFETIISQDAIAVGIGDTQLSGDFYGFNLSKVIPTESIKEISDFMKNTSFNDEMNIPMVRSLRGFPVFSPSALTMVSSVTVVNSSVLQGKTLDLSTIQQFLADVKQFQNVRIKIEQGLAFFGINESHMSYVSNSSFAISTFADFPFDSIGKIHMLAILSNQTHVMNYHGNISMLYPALESTKISISTMDGTSLWDQYGSDFFLILHHEHVSINENSSIHLLPIFSDTKNPTATVKITPSLKEKIDFNQLMSELKQLNTIDSNITFPFNFSNQKRISTVFNSVFPILNGGILLLENNRPLLIDGSSRQPDSILFIESEQATITIHPSFQSLKKINGQAGLFFIDDHFYSADAGKNDDGLFVPLLPIIFWIAALCFFLYFKYVHHKKENKEKHEVEKKISYLLLGIHLCALIIVFVFLDFIVRYHLEMSFFYLISNNLFSIVTVLFLGFQFLLWTLGYISCALPLQYIARSLVQFSPLKKTEREIGKSIGLIGVLFFSGFYTILVLNIILFIVRPLLPSVPMR